MGLVRLGLSPRASGLTRAQAQAHWGGAHAQLFARVPRVRSYVQNHALLDAQGVPLLGDPGFDIFSEVEFDSEEDMSAAMASSWYREQVVADEQRLLDATRRCFLVTRRHVTGEPGPSDCKLVVFLAGAQPGDRARAQLHDGAAGGVVIYAVESVGGAAPRQVDLVLARGCASADEAMDLHRVLLSARDGLNIEAAVIVRENEVVPRARGRLK